MPNPKSNPKSAQTALVQIRLDKDVKDSAEAILEELGLSLVDAFRIFTKKIIADSGFNFNLTIPSKSHKYSDLEITQIEKILDEYYKDKSKSTIVDTNEDLHKFLKKLDSSNE
jgi:DNA-damage-inducible protein J